MFDAKILRIIERGKKRGKKFLIFLKFPFMDFKKDEGKDYLKH